MLYGVVVNGSGGGPSTQREEMIAFGTACCGTVEQVLVGGAILAMPLNCLCRPSCPRILRHY